MQYVLRGFNVELLIWLIAASWRTRRWRTTVLN